MGTAIYSKFIKSKHSTKLFGTSVEAAKFFKTSKAFNTDQNQGGYRVKYRRRHLLHPHCHDGPFRFHNKRQLRCQSAKIAQNFAKSQFFELCRTSTLEPLIRTKYATRND